MLTIHNADALTALKDMEPESVQTCVTSPPYWGLRDYGFAGQIGLEKTPEEYVAAIVDVFREVRRVLRDNGTIWVNLGDSYSASGKGPTGWNGIGDQETRPGFTTCKPKDRSVTRWGGGGNNAPGLKPKDLVGIPWMVAFALRADGWYLRSEITWCKQAPMPESVTDRPTSATEKIFLLSKSKQYFYDQDGVRERYAESSIQRVSQPTFDTQTGGDKDPHNGNRSARKSLTNLKARVDKQRGHSRRHAGFNDRWDAMSKDEQCANGANLRNYWVLAPNCFPDAHFATFPRDVPRRCILLGTNFGDVVLDPFAGSGTTGKVAIELGRRAVLIEPNPEYVKMIERRTTTTMGLQFDAPARDAGTLPD